MFVNKAEYESTLILEEEILLLRNFFCDSGRPVLLLLFAMIVFALISFSMVHSHRNSPLRPRCPSQPPPPSSSPILPLLPLQ